jgi:hypothetical protein
MANERQWDAVPPVLLTADGTTEGVLQVVDTAGFFFDMQATLVNNTPTQLTVYIKRVVDKNTLWVGPKKGGLDHNVDVSLFTVASGSRISAQMQNKSSVPMESRLQATYETDPIDAWRVRPVDSYGNGYSDSNPLPVAFDGTVSIGDVHILGPSPTNNELIVNADGSINVIVESVPSPNTTVVSTYNEMVLVASGATVLIVSYTVPIGMQAVLQRAPFSGENVARYDLLINGVSQDTARTMFGGDLTGEFNFTTGNDSGYILSAGTVVSVQVFNNRPSTASFEARIQALQIPI